MIPDRKSSSILSLRTLAVAGFAWAALLSVPAIGQVRTSVVKVPSGTKSINVECFVPDEPGKHPAVILLHPSGGLENAVGPIFRDIASALATRGYVTLIPHYFEKTDHVVGRALRQGEYEEMLDAVKDVIDYAAAQPEVDAARFGLIGYSMGSNIAMFRAARDTRIKAVAAWSGAFPPVKPNKKLPPLLILHGSKDKSTPLELVKKYQDALKEEEMPHAVHVYNGMGHNFDNTKFEDATLRTVAFFDQYIKGAAPRR